MNSLRFILCATFVFLCAAALRAQDIRPETQEYSLIWREVSQKRSISAENVTQGSITAYSVSAKLVGSYATTIVTSTIVNIGSAPSEIVFAADLPESAFISAFSITIDSKTFEAVVVEKQQAQQIYDNAKRNGNTAGLVAQRGMSKFVFSFLTAAQTTAIFRLRYEGIVPRRFDKYELQLPISTGQVVPNFELVAQLYQQHPGGISNVEAPSFTFGTNVTFSRFSFASVTFNPSIAQQQSVSSTGLTGVFIVRCTPAALPTQGQFFTHDGSFVHIFAPRSLPPMSKDFVFVVDVSGSMAGTKMIQTKAALKYLVSQLRDGDYFNFVIFSDLARSWKSSLIASTSASRSEASSMIETLVADGGTNINEAMTAALSLFNAELPRAPMVILLTDGEPTVGVTGTADIRANVRRANVRSVPIYSLGFGLSLDYEFLRLMSFENYGFDRRIYESSDAVEQLTSVFSELSSPLLRSISLQYAGATDVTISSFGLLFEGSEIVVAGHYPLDALTIGFTAGAYSASGAFMISDNISVADAATPEPFVNRLWAYLRIRQLLTQYHLNENPATKQAALSLALQYQYVTELTSMVISVNGSETPPGLSDYLGGGMQNAGMSESNTLVASILIVLVTSILVLLL